MQLTLAHLLYALSDWHPDELEMPVYPIIDSREAEPGTVFFAFEGERVDGHDYVGDAFAHGAVAAVVQKRITPAGSGTLVDLVEMEVPVGPLTTPIVILVPDVLEALQRAARWWRTQILARVIGVTGSVGKTTTKEVVSRVLERRFQVARSRGSYNNEIGLPLTILRLTGEDERVVLEMGMYVRGDIRFLAGIARPDVGVVTNVEPVHAERAGTIEDIARGKRELVEVLPPGPEGVAILNFDDARVRAMASYTAARIVTYGLSPEADLWADGVESEGLQGLKVTLHESNEVVDMSVPLLGRHSVYPVLRAAAVARAEGLDWDEIAAGLQTVASLRLVAVPGKDGSTIIDDTYNSSPPSALAALDLLEDLQGRKVAVLGDMLELGDYEREGHLEVGCRAAEVVSELVVVGALGEIIGEGAEACGLAPNRIHRAADSSAAVDIVQALLQPDDVVLVKGSRGVRMERIVEALRESAS